MINGLAEKFRKQFTYLGEDSEKFIIFTIPIEKEITRTDKNREQITKIYPTYYNLFIVQDLWQAQYKILPIFFLKEFIKLNVNTDMMIKNVKFVESNISTATIFLNKQTLKII